MMISYTIEIPQALPQEILQCPRCELYVRAEDYDGEFDQCAYCVHQHYADVDIPRRESVEEWADVLGGKVKE